MLAACDMALSVFYIPIVVTATGCNFLDYGSALYFAHFGWTTACTFHALGTYVIVFLSLDRFVGVWFPTLFKRLQQPPFGFLHRMVAMVVVCVGVHLPFMVDATVECEGFDEEEIQLSDNSSCPNGSWVSSDGFENSFNERWHEVYRYFYNLMVRWLPYGLLAVFNFSLVVAVSLGKVRFPGTAATEVTKVDPATGTLRSGNRRQARNSERVLVVTVIAMTASYVVLTLPITIFLTALAGADTDRCSSPSPEETLRHVGNIFQLLEHVLHAVFLVLINPRFRRETLRLLGCRDSSGGEGDTTTPDDDLASATRPVSSASRSYSLVVKVRNSTVPPSCHKL
uniref:G-protein coupled receptors family 1 profile domain-containing protein n=1 Tax=Scylla olivacea TaxID=85551 RepID=A0A0P4WI41_SCYOL